MNTVMCIGVPLFHTSGIICSLLVKTVSITEHHSILDTQAPMMVTIFWFFCSISGKGEQGKPYPLTEEDNDDSAYRENGFNIFVSNNIALERSLPDIRHPK